MIRRNSDKTVERFDNKFGGNGFITVRSLINSPEEMNNRGRVFAHTTVLPGHGIGYHVHQGDTEIYYIYSGKAEYNDNGTITQVEAGDVTFTPSGTGHGITNTGDEPLELIALILYEDSPKQ